MRLKVVIATAAGAFLLAACTSTSTTPTQNGGASNASGTSSFNSSQFQVDFTALGTDFQNIATDASSAASNGDTSALLADCQQLQTDVQSVQNDGVPPALTSSEASNLAQVVTDVSSSATSCINGINNNDPNQIQDATNSLNAATSLMGTLSSALS